MLYTTARFLCSFQSWFCFSLLTRPFQRSSQLSSTQPPASHLFLLLSCSSFPLPPQRLFCFSYLLSLQHFHFFLLINYLRASVFFPDSLNSFSSFLPLPSVLSPTPILGILSSSTPLSLQYFVSYLLIHFSLSSVVPFPYFTPLPLLFPSSSSISCYLSLL